MTATPPESRDLLARLIAAEQAVAPTPATRSANWAGVRARLELAAPAAATTTTVGLGKALAVVLGLGAAVTIAALAGGAPQAEPLPVAPAAASESHVPKAMSDETPGALPAAPASESHVYKTMSDETPGALPVAEKTSWDAELELLQRVQAALKEDRAADALTHVGTYEQRWPQGVFIEEIQVARALAVCGLGDRKAARRALARFQRSWSRSFYLAQVEQRCAEPSGRDGP